MNGLGSGTRRGAGIAPGGAESTRSSRLDRTPEQLYAGAVRDGLVAGLRRGEARRAARALSRHLDVLEIDPDTGAARIHVGRDLFETVERIPLKAPRPHERAPRLG